ncbi:radical SAM protein, partial [Flavobacteriales bacterium]|nr:radical SAM protein [Flavobacteriales bacterium]
MAVHFDPVNACNLRCKMCYFTDKDYVKKLKGIFPKDDLKNFGKSILSRALKLQIGCGTEPTLYKHLKEVIEIGKSYNVPFISITTNANTIELNQLKEWCEAGLNEITVSLHGVTKKSYEYFMGKGNFQRFLQSLNYINIVKQEFPSLKLRINYTFNEDNFEELNNFWEIFKDFNIDTLQIRPIKKMGETEYSNFSLKKIIPNYEKIHQKLIDECKKRNTSFLAPKLHQIQERTSISSIIQNFTYC